MKSLMILVAAVGLAGMSYANGTNAPAAPAAKMAKVSPEVRKQCKETHQKDHKGYVDCLKAASIQK